MSGFTKSRSSSGWATICIVCAVQVSGVVTVTVTAAAAVARNAGSRSVTVVTPMLMTTATISMTAVGSTTLRPTATARDRRRDLVVTSRRLSPPSVGQHGQGSTSDRPTVRARVTSRSAGWGVDRDKR